MLSCNRGNLYRFDDFLTAWSEKLRAKEPTSMTVRLQQDVEKYKVNSLSSDWEKKVSVSRLKCFHALSSGTEGEDVFLFHSVLHQTSLIYM